MNKLVPVEPTIDACFAAGQGARQGVGFVEGGMPNTPEERARFEAYMRGHCWEIGKYYSDHQCYDTVTVRMLYGVWRDRGMLAASSAGRNEALEEATRRLIGFVKDFTRNFARDVPDSDRNKGIGNRIADALDEYERALKQPDGNRTAAKPGDAQQGLPERLATYPVDSSASSAAIPVCGQHSIPGKPAEHTRPIIVCLCGSTRFMEAFQAANLAETLAGRIVLSIGCDTKSDDNLQITPAQKAALDELHKRKIDIADEILVLNVGGYIGKSTRSEIDYAIAHSKRIRYLEPAEREPRFTALDALRRGEQEPTTGQPRVLPIPMRNETPTTLANTEHPLTAENAFNMIRTAATHDRLIPGLTEGQTLCSPLHAPAAAIPGKSAEQALADQPCADSRVTLTVTVEEIERQRKNLKAAARAAWSINSLHAVELKIDHICDQALAAIDLKAENERLKKDADWPHCEECNFPLQDQGTPNGMVCLLCDARAEVERLKMQVAERGQLLGAAIIRLQELGETTFEFGEVEAPRTITEAQISEVIAKNNPFHVAGSTHATWINSACREVLALAGVKVEP